MLSAPPKLGKSTLLSFVCAQVSCGAELWGKPLEEARRVLWVGLEEHLSDPVARFAELGADGSRTILVDRLEGSGGLQQLRAEAEAAQPALVVVDSLSAYARELEDENSATMVNRLLLPLVEWVHASPWSMVLLHHATKSGSGYRGSGAIGAAMDVIIEMSHPDKAPPSQRHFVVRGRLPLEDYTLDFDRETKSWTLVGTSGGTDPSHYAQDGQASQSQAELLCERVLRVLREKGNLNKEALRAAVGGRATAVDQAIYSLMAAHQIRHLSRNEGYAIIEDSET
jgi:hypothetical protein